MDKIKAENNDLMKDVASLSGKLDRAFHVTDELIFKDATKVGTLIGFMYLSHKKCEPIGMCSRFRSDAK